jgi:hypothetical protein
LNKTLEQRIKELEKEVATLKKASKEQQLRFNFQKLSEVINLNPFLKNFDVNEGSNIRTILASLAYCLEHVSTEL